ncbi:MULTISPECIES: peptidoglycan-binding domain-containing protein [Streptomyces]|uniref:peptidoglycan-binding domain-containing protein n=1 Tax=Streptomyces TaxID=1883 RepID=UPI000BD824B8|nr:hypothetical protein [Streptomyces sp. OK228]SOE26288.1 hypothetical protein SAMN05442782_3055 [Streptomyces sp. OK228]
MTECHARACRRIAADQSQSPDGASTSCVTNGVVQPHGYRARLRTKSQAAAADFQRPANKYYGVTLTVDGKVGPKTWPVLRAHAL